MIEVERDGRLGIDLKFGTIAFENNGDGPHAAALIDVIIPQTEATRQATRVQMEIKVPIDPAVDPVLHMAEKCRSHIIATLRAAANTFEATSAEALLFQSEQ